MQSEQVIGAVVARLEAARVEVGRVADTLNVKYGQGLVAHKANITLDALMARLSASDVGAHDRLIAGFVSGVCAVLAEPLNSKAAGWEFRQAAARMMINVEVDTFILGAEAAGERPWVMPLEGDLVMVVVLQLDRGLRVVSQQQVEAWGTTRDRLAVAARSMLFHRTREVAQREPVEGAPGVQRIKVGDGWDAARSIVIPDLFFAEINEAKYRFIMPHQDVLYFTEEDGSGAPTAALIALAKAEYAAAKYPISEAIFKLAQHTPTLA